MVIIKHLMNVFELWMENGWHVCLCVFVAVHKLFPKYDFTVHLDVYVKYHLEQSNHISDTLYFMWKTIKTEYV